MNSRERFKGVLNFDTTVDRVPVVEWAAWWDQTLDNWYKEGLSKNIEVVHGLSDYWKLDKLHQFWFVLREKGFPLEKKHGSGILSCPEEYQQLKKMLYTDQILFQAEKTMKNFLALPDSEEYAIWFTLEGFFWFPRTLLGIENHLYAFYDEKDFMLEINQDLCRFYHKLIEVIYSTITPQFMTFAEDMSYNNGPMVSQQNYLEFIHPFYQELIPLLKKQETKVFIDTDGDVEPLIPWFLESGIDGILPLERMAGVDVERIRQKYPKLLMLGAFDKTVISKGEKSIKAEFERLLPVIQSGGYIPAVDHQTPPDVSMENYSVYINLLEAYAQRYPER